MGDLMTDVAGYYLTTNEGDLAFANDPSGWVSGALLVSVVVGAVAFVVEVLYHWRNSPDDFRGWLPELQSLHSAARSTRASRSPSARPAPRITTEATSSSACTRRTLPWRAARTAATGGWTS